jgi:hypothetical protein
MTDLLGDPERSDQPSRPAFAAVKKGAPRGSGYERVANDFYVEPASAVRALLGAERFWGTIWDPACGSGTIPEVCREQGLDTFGTDIVDRGYKRMWSERNFLDCEPPADFDMVITNPPYHIAEAFTRRAVEITPHKVAILVRLAFLEGERRYQRLFKPLPPTRVLVFRNRVSCPPGRPTTEFGDDFTPITPKGGAVAYCWIIWSKDHRGPTQTDWIKAE